MRRGVLTRLILLAVAAPVLAHNAAYAGKDNKQPAATAVTKEFAVEGKPQAFKEDAIDSALQMASDEIAAYLHDLKPALIWKPDLNYVRERLLNDLDANDPKNAEWTPEQLGNHTILVKTSEVKVGPADHVYQVRLGAVVSAQELAHMREHDQKHREKVRQELIPKRQLWLGKILLGFVALLTAVSGYIRLEDATKGYYTGLLRLGMVGVLCAVGAGLWLIR